MTTQIIWGSLVLCICCFLHLMMMVAWVKVLGKLTAESKLKIMAVKQSVIVGGTLLMIIVANTTQVWIWAFSLIKIGALQSYEDAVYFSLVTFTTVGYGDLTLETQFRIFGAMASITGLLSFGISTAFLVNLLTRLFPGPK